MPASSRSTRRLLRPVFCKAGLGILSVLACSCFADTAGAQTNYYWDGNGNTTGAGTATQVTGTWGTSAFWSTDATGNSATTATGPGSGDYAIFTAFDNVAANNPAAGYTVTLGSAQSVQGLIIGPATYNATYAGNDGTPTFAGTGSPGLTIGTGGFTVNGSNGDPTFAASIGSITLAGDQTWNINNAHALSVAAAVAGNATTGNTRVWTLGYINAFTPTVSGVISDGAAGGALALTLNNVNTSGNPATLGSIGAGTWSLTGIANTYTGATTISAGNLQFSLLANAGTVSSLGAGSLINLGTGTTNTVSLTYVGTTASSTNRTVNLAGTTGGGSILNNSTAATSTLSFTSALTNTGSGAKTFTLGGSNLGANSFGGAIVDSAGGNLTLAKTGVGFWSLGGANTYSGGTTISNGTLSVAAAGTLGTNAAGNNITVSGGNLLLSAASNYGANQNVIVNSGGIGVGYTPASLPVVTDNTGATGGIYGINYTGTGAVTSEAAGSLYNGNWFLGSFTGGTYTGASLGAGNAIPGTASGATGAYRLGGGGGTLTFQNSGVLTGSNDLLVGNNASGGNVILPGGNTFTGTTTLQNGTLTVSSLNRVTGGTASSSLGAPTTAANGTIAMGSGANAVTLNYAGTGETTDRVLNLAGTTGTVTLQNSGTGALVFGSAPTFTGVGAKTLTLGTAADTFGGTIGPITNTASANVVTVNKAGLTDSTWNLTGTNTYTGTTTITGGVLSMSTVPAGYIVLNGANNATQLGVLQTTGTIARTLSATSAATNLNWQSNSGFAAIGGGLSLTFSAGATLTWGTNGFMGTGTNPMVFGSNTANNQVTFTNNFTLGDNVSNGFNRTIFVDKGVGGDSALLTGVISLGTGTGGNTLLNGINKTGNGTLMLSGASTYTGTTSVGAGTLVAMNSVASGMAGPFGNAATTITLGLANINGSDGTVATNASPSLQIGGAFAVARPVTVSSLATTGTYSIGGNTDNAATFSGLITTFQNLTVTQAATTGTNALNITGGIVGGASTATKTVTFNNVGAVNVSTTAIGDGAGGGKVALTKANVGTLTLSGTNTYTGATTISGGTVNLTLAGTNSGTVITGGTLKGATPITISGGTLSLAANNTLTPTSTVALAGGVFQIGNTVLQGQGATHAAGALTGTSIQGAGMLSLAANSTLNYAGATGTVVFSGFTPAGFTLNVTGTNFGTATDSADSVNDRLIFTSTLTTAQLSNITFTVNGATVAATETALDSTFFEVLPSLTPVPEPSTWAAGMLGTFLLAAYAKRKRASL